MQRRLNIQRAKEGHREGDCKKFSKGPTRQDKDGTRQVKAKQNIDMISAPGTIVNQLLPLATFTYLSHNNSNTRGKPLTKKHFTNRGLIWEIIHVFIGDGDILWEISFLIFDPCYPG